MLISTARPDCCSTMATLFRSEPMSKCQLYLPPEAAYNCVAELGELGSRNYYFNRVTPPTLVGLVQFVDLNPEVSAFQRQFVSEVKRCEEMERILRFVETEALKEKIEIPDQKEENFSAPAPREMVELESNLTTIETNLKEVNTNYVALRYSHMDSWIVGLKYFQEKPSGVDRAEEHVEQNRDFSQ